MYRANHLHATIRRFVLLAIFTLPAVAFAAHLGPANYYPNTDLTPGAVYHSASRDEVCVPGYSKTVRNVPMSTRRQVFKRYSVPYANRSHYELDHFVSLELGGNNAVQNLWPEPLTDAKKKDQVENWLHRQVCDGNVTLIEAQNMIEEDWYGIYIEHHLDKSHPKRTHHSR